MRLIYAFIGLLVCLAGMGCQEPIDVPVIGGAFIGYVDKYSETPVVRESIDLGYDYTAKFWAYDLGEEARFIAYAQRERTGVYYDKIMRLSIRDPDGNMFTLYRNFEAEPVDSPVIWKPRVKGDHTVQLEFQLLNEKARVEFIVPLVREPIPVTLLAGIGGIVILVGAIGFFLKKRQQRA